MKVLAGIYKRDAGIIKVKGVAVDVAVGAARLGLRVMLRGFNIPVLAPAVAQGSVDTRNMVLATDEYERWWALHRHRRTRREIARATAILFKNSLNIKIGNSDE